MYIKYQISPKLIDDSGNEQNLPNFVINTSFDDSKGDQRIVIENADKYVSLDIPENTKSFDLQSDEAVNIAFYDELGTTKLLELENVYNQIIKSEGFLNIIKVRNLSGSVATILYRAFS